MYIQPSRTKDSHYDDSLSECIRNINFASLRLLRWLNIIAMNIMALVIYFSPPQDTSIQPLLVVLFTTITFNLFLTTQSRKYALYRKPFLALELAFDILAWTTFVYFYGGVSNPLVFFLLTLVTICATVLPTRQAWGLGLLTTLIYSLLWEFHQHPTTYESRLAAHLHWLSMWLTFAISVAVCIWVITRTTKTIQKCSCDLSAARESALRDKWIVSLGGIAAGTAHELSTPLSTLSTLVEEMQTSQEPVYVSRADLELMERQLKVCCKALTQLTQLDYPLPEETECCAVDEWLCRLGHTSKTLHPDAEISIALDPNLSRLCLVPDIALEQAVRNLLDNAIAAHPKGIKLSACCNSSNLEILVADRGPGIHQVTLQQLERGLPLKSEQGLGLGLALAKSAVDRYGGRIEFNNLAQGGTEVKMVLPLDEGLLA
jgi:two-component system, sensor histidine kinase RegB